MNLLADQGEQAISDFRQAYPLLRESLYSEATLDLEITLQDADVVIVHEWNSGDLVRRIGEHRASHPRYRLYFQDTHHRAVTDPRLWPNTTCATTTEC